MDILIYTHSDYFDILPVQLYYFSKLFQDNSNIFLCTNKEVDCVYTRVLYDDTLPYASRILSCIQQIQTNNTYILIIHENDALIRFDQLFIDILLNKMKEHTVDSLELKQGVSNIDLIEVNDMIYLTHKGKWCDYKYSVQPTIWYKPSFIHLLSKFHDKTYRTIECDDVHNYVRDNLKAYSIYDTQSIQTMWYHVSNHFVFLHLTSRLLLLPCSKNNGLEPFIQDEHEYIYNNFLSNTTREKQPTMHSYLSHMVTDFKW